MSRILFSLCAVMAVLGAFCAYTQIREEHQTSDWLSPNRLAPEQIEKNQMQARIRMKLPYTARGDYMLGSLGQLSKLCDWVVIGKIVSVKQDLCEERHAPTLVTLNVETNLYGKVSGNQITVHLDWWESRIIPYRKNDRALVFISKENYGQIPYDALMLDFDKNKSGCSSFDLPVVVGGERGFIMLDGGGLEKELLTAVDGYLTTMRREKRERKAVYTVLRKLVLSSVDRVRDDARSDIVVLLRQTPLNEIKEVLADTNIDNDIKEYVRLVLIPDGEKKQP